MEEKIIELKGMLNEAISQKEDDNCNYEVCKNCKNCCCKRMGCHISPRDIKGEINKETIDKLLNTGLVSIDWWEGDTTNTIEEEKYENVYFLRIRNDNGSIVDPSFGGKCILYDNDKGCPLEYGYRPRGARLLIPNKTGNCHSQYSKLDCAKEWRQYYDILFELKDKYYDDAYRSELDWEDSLIGMLLGL